MPSFATSSTGPRPEAFSKSESTAGHQNDAKEKVDEDKVKAANTNRYAKLIAPAPTRKTSHLYTDSFYADTHAHATQQNLLMDEAASALMEKMGVVRDAERILEKHSTAGASSLGLGSAKPERETGVATITNGAVGVEASESDADVDVDVDETRPPSGVVVQVKTPSIQEVADQADHDVDVEDRDEDDAARPMSSVIASRGRPGILQGGRKQSQSQPESGSKKSVTHADAHEVVSGTTFDEVSDADAGEKGNAFAPHEQHSAEAVAARQRSSVPASSSQDIEIDAAEDGEEDEGREDLSLRADDDEAEDEEASRASRKSKVSRSSTNSALSSIHSVMQNEDRRKSELERLLGANSAGSSDGTGKSAAVASGAGSGALKTIKNKKSMSSSSAAA